MKKLKLEVGDYAADFTLKDQNGRDFIFKKENNDLALVIFFYPKDESLVCTKQACAFRDNYRALKQHNIQLVGINCGTMASHKQFDSNHNLGFPILCDKDNVVLKLFGVRPKLFLSGRETFVIDKTGKILFKQDSFLNGTSHSKKVLEFLDLNPL